MTHLHVIFVGDFPHERHDWFDAFAPAELRRTDLGSKNERIALSHLLRENVTANERISHTNYLRVGGGPLSQKVSVSVPLHGAFRTKPKQGPQRLLGPPHSLVMRLVLV